MVRSQEKDEDRRRDGTREEDEECSEPHGDLVRGGGLHVGVAVPGPGEAHQLRQAVAEAGGGDGGHGGEAEAAQPARLAAHRAEAGGRGRVAELHAEHLQLLQVGGEAGQVGEVEGRVWLLGGRVRAHRVRVGGVLLPLLPRPRPRHHQILTETPGCGRRASLRQVGGKHHLLGLGLLTLHLQYRHCQVFNFQLYHETSAECKFKNIYLDIF